MKKFTLLVSITLFIVMAVQNAFGQWHTLSSETSENIRLIKFINTNTGFIAGTSQLQRTTDAGTHWQSITLDSIEDKINSFVFSDEKTGYVASNNTISKTTNSGSSWQTIYHYSVPINSVQTYPDMMLDETGQGIYVLSTTVTGYYSYNGQLVHIRFNGNEILSEAAPLLDINGHNLIGNSLSRLSDGQYRVHASEHPWIVMHDALSSSLIDFSGLTANSVVGFPGQIRCLSGDTYFLHQWHNIYPSSEVNTLKSLNIAQSNNIFYLHLGSTIFNGQWQADSTYGYNYFPNAISRTHNDRIYFVGSFSPDRDNVQPSAIKYYTVSGGSIHNDNSYSSTATLQCLTETADAIYAGGEGGLLIKLPLSYIPSAIVLENTRPGDFSLGNYPNPFNPLTNIEYTLPRDGFVSIQIFDSIGREIRQLVSGCETAGTHTVVFDASLLSSGTYYCRLEYNGSIKTKAIVLIK